MSSKYKISPKARYFTDSTIQQTGQQKHGVESYYVWTQATNIYKPFQTDKKTTVVVDSCHSCGSVFWGHSWDASVLAAAPVYLQDHHGPKRCVVRQTSSDLDGGVIVQMAFWWVHHDEIHTIRILYIMYWLQYIPLKINLSHPTKD